MADSSGFNRIEDHLTDRTHVPLRGVANDISTSPQSSPSSAGLTLLHTLEGHTQSVNSFAWSPDGTQLASCSLDQTVRLWNPRTGRLLHRLEGHTQSVNSFAWSPDGTQLASCSEREVLLWNPSNGLRRDNYNGAQSVAWSPDGTQLASCSGRGVLLWNPSDGRLLHTLMDDMDSGTSIPWSTAGGRASAVWSPDGTQLASCSGRGVLLWNPSDGRLLHTLMEGNMIWAVFVAWSPDGTQLASCSGEGTVRLWNPKTGRLLHRLEGHPLGVKSAVAWSPDGTQLASCSGRGVLLWNPSDGRLLHRLEGHTDSVKTVAWSPDGKLLTAGGRSFISSTPVDYGFNLRIWRTDTWEPLAVLTGLKGSFALNSLAVWHPHLPMLVTPGQQGPDIFVWHLDLARLLQASPSSETVHYANAKAVLVGDSGVGKSGLALVLTGQPFAPTDSTHGRHVWLLDQQEVQLKGGPHETREVWLWDLAGQPDYRLIHQLHLHEATVALIVFDAARDTDPFAGIRQWHRALRLAQQAHGSTMPLPIFLVAARIDRGRIGVSRKRIDSLVQELGCADYVETSAKDGRGIAELGQIIRTAIDWTSLPKVTSTKLLQAIKTFVLNEQHAGRLLRTVDDLYNAFLRSPDTPVPSDGLHQQFETVLGRLEAQGVIRYLGFGNMVLLQPERLDAYASALLIAVKDEPDGLGIIPEARVQQGDFSVPAEDRFPNPAQEQLLLIAMIEELVRHQVALREGGFLLFPSQSTREHPDRAALENRQTITFTFAGPTLSLYTTLVVRLAQSSVFQKQDLWQHVVTYTTQLGGLYGLLLSPRGEERADLGLFFDETAREEMRFHFENFVQTHLERYAGGTVQRRRRFVCPHFRCGFVVTEQLVQLLSQQGTRQFACPACHTTISLLNGVERLSTSPSSLVKTMEQAADDQRDRESAASLLEGKRATKDFDVFLCHHGQDKPTVRLVGEQLKLHGILPWLDEWELRPGLPWQQLLEQQIEQIKAAAIFVGKSGIGPWQQQELNAFLREFVNRGCPVIPVLLADAPQKPELPVFLKAMTWVDFRVQYPDPMQQLLWGITGKREEGEGMRRGG